MTYYVLINGDIAEEHEDEASAVRSAAELRALGTCGDDDEYEVEVLAPRG